MHGLDPGMLFRRPKKDRRDMPGDDDVCGDTLLKYART